MRWNTLTASVENDLLNALKQNPKLLDLRLKGNRFSENLFGKINLHLQGTLDRTKNYTKEAYYNLKKEVEQVSQVTDTAKSGESV